MLVRPPSVLPEAARALGVPDHAPGFERELRVRLSDQRARPEPRPLRRRYGRVVVLAVTVAGAAAAAVAVFGLTRGSDVATAAEVRAAVSETLASAKSIRGVVEIHGPSEARVPEDGLRAVIQPAVHGSDGGRWSFLATASGDFALRGLTDRREIVYDADALVVKVSDGTHFSVLEGHAAETGLGGPDWVLQQGIGSVVAALADARGDVAEVVYQGRSAWLLEVSTGGIGRDGDGTAIRRVTVDRELKLPVRDVLIVRNGGDERKAGEWRLVNLEVDAPVAPGALSLEPRAEQEVRRSDLGFRRVDLRDVEAIVGYEPLVPSSLPPGFRLVTTAAAANVPAYDNTRLDAVSLTYRRGLEEIVVETRRSSERFGPTGRPGSFCSLRGPSVMVCLPDREERWTRQVEIESGALAGERATLVVELSGRPRARASTGDLDVTVAGDVLPEEILRVTSSLERWQVPRAG